MAGSKSKPGSSSQGTWFNPVFVSQIAIFVEFFGFGEQITLLPFFLNGIGAPETGLGMVLAAQQGGIVIGSTLLGWFSDTHGRKNAVLLSLAANSLLSLVAAVCRTELLILIIRFTTGLLTISTPSLSWLLANCTPEEKSQAIARWISGLLLGIGLGSVVGGYVGQRWGWGASMILCAVQGVIVFFCGLYAKDNQFEQPERPSEVEAQETTPLVQPAQTHMWTMGCSPYFIILVLASFVDGTSILSLHSTLAYLLMEDYGWQQDAIGAMNGVYALVCILTTWFLLRPVINALGAFKASLVGMLCKSLSMVLVGLAVDGPWRLYCASCLLFGLVYNLANPSLVALVSDMCEAFAPDHMGALVGILRSANSVGSTVGPVFAVPLLIYSRMLPFVVLATAQFVIFVALALARLWDRSNWFLDQNVIECKS